MECYRLKKRMLDIAKGTVFIHVDWDADMPERGNIGSGALVIAWKNGNTQGRWCGGAIALPGQYANSEFFEKVSTHPGVYHLSKPKIRKRKDECEDTEGPCSLVDICMYFTPPEKK